MSSGTRVTRRAGRRWARAVVGCAAALAATLLAVYGWASLSLDRSSIARAIIWMDSDTDDQQRFPARPVPTGGDPSVLRRSGQGSAALDPSTAAELDELVRATGTRAFLVVHADRVVYERYLQPSDRDDLRTSFSVAKSVLSTLVGIAIGEGLIGSVDDPVTEYLPDLAERDPRFERITLHHLLTMSSGLRFEEEGLPVPWGDEVEAYYGTDLRELALTKTEIEGPPGQTWRYNDYNPLLLGLVLERATGMPVSEYLSTRVWAPIGARHDATWSLDSRGSGFEKMESGFNAAPADYARFGLLFLHGGSWNGRSIVPGRWVDRATSPIVTTAHGGGYGYFWWTDAQRPERFYALGHLGQYIYVAPDTSTVVVRLGDGWAIRNDAWLALFRDVADGLERET